MTVDDFEADFTPEARAKVEARASRGREAIEKRWGPYREARVAAGLPATKTQGQKRSPRFIMDPEVEAFWLDRVRELGLGDGKGRTALRVQAKRLSDASAEEDARHYQSQDLASPPPGDDAILATFWEQEAERWRTRARRDRRMATVHDGLANEAEQELVRVTQRLDGAL